MRQFGSLVLSALLFCSTATEAARSPRRRAEQGAPYLLLPPEPVIEGAGRGQAPESLRELDFTLRHIYHHGTHQYPDLHRKLDIPLDARVWVSGDGEGETFEAPKLRAKSMTTSIQRLADRRQRTIDHLLDAASFTGHALSLPSSSWSIDKVPGPNNTDKETVLSFARMASDAYALEAHGADWQDVGGGFNYTEDFGWESDGLRGHIFADPKNSTIVIGLKGTSPAVFDGADTTGNDKLNDNLFGSCCCGQGGQYLWKQVCDCMTGTYTCNNTCLVKSLREKSRYYWAVRDLYHNVTERYPESDIWLSGHSLGGVVSSLLGLTYGLPVMTFEAFPDALASSRLGLPTPPGYRIGSHQSRGSLTGASHFGHTADPIYMGTCNGASSFCTLAGYAFQGICHTGLTCQYDTVGDLGWRVGIGTHKINNVIKDVIEKYDTVPKCEEDVECQDCFNWKFYESNGTVTTTSRVSSSTSTRTRTATCKTPGWWGCLDESTTSAPTTTSTSLSSTSTCKTPGWFGCKDKVTTTTTTSTSLSSTSTCKTPGWFGCKDEVTTTTASSRTLTSSIAAPAPTITGTSAHTASSSTTCLQPGWFGCKDPSTTTTPPTPLHTASKVTASATSSHAKCKSKESFGLICVDPSPDVTTTISQMTSSTQSSTSLPTAKRKYCVRRHWWGGCKQWLENDIDWNSDL